MRSAPNEIPTPGKLKKQLKYASDIGCQYVAIAGETEMQNGKLMVKDLISGEQQERSVDDIILLLQ